MEPFGHGEVMVMDLEEKMIKHIDHHQLKYQVLHGIMHGVVMKACLQSKLMVHYGDGEEMVVVN